MRGKCIGLITYLAHWCYAILQGLHNFLFPPLYFLRFRTLLARLQSTSCILVALAYILIKAILSTLQLSLILHYIIALLLNLLLTLGRVSLYQPLYTVHHYPRP